MDPNHELSPAAAAAQRCAHAFFAIFAKYPKAEQGSYDWDEIQLRAANAFRQAMPCIESWENLPIFLACVTRGMELRVFEPAEASKFLYAAQVAANIMRPPKPEKAAKKQTPPPPLSDIHGGDDSDYVVSRIPEESRQAELYKELRRRGFPLPPDKVLRQNWRVALYLCDVSQALIDRYPPPGAKYTAPGASDPPPPSVQEQAQPQTAAG